MSQQLDNPGPRSTVSGERRVVTALFCDIVGSTTIAEQLDPEDWAEIVGGAVEALTEPVLYYEGTVVRLLGDALLSFFGAPVAHEDDPRRAVLAALEMIEAMEAHRGQVRRDYGVDFDVRIGINTGPAVVGDIGGGAASEYTALGDAVNVAARMEQTAQPGTIRIAHDTYRLVAPIFDVDELGPVEVKGKAEPVVAYRVLAEKQTPGRTRGLEGISAPLVGREREFDTIKEALDGLASGRGGIVIILGEAGLGKSRLLQESRAYWEQLRPDGDWDTATGSPYDTNRPYGLFQRFARERFGVLRDDPPGVIHHKVDEGLRAAGADDETVALCSVALERIIAMNVLHDAKSYEGAEVRDDIATTIAYPAWRAKAERNPTVHVMDDVHWADQASVDLLSHLFNLVDEVPALFICALRPERQSPGWGLKVRAETDFPHRYVEINLQPLDAAGTSELVNALLRIADLPDSLRALILRKTDGNPYFIEEIVRTLIEEGVVYQTDDGLRWHSDTSVDDIAIPDTLQALLMARIDRLDRESRATMQMASVIGRSFYRRILEGISDSAMTLDRHLVALQRVDLVNEASRVPELEYIFKHELTRDAAYNTILNRKRRELHRRVAEAIETLFPDRLTEHAHRLAVHNEVAGDLDRALHYRLMAAEGAVAMGASGDAAVHFAAAADAGERSGAHPEQVADLRRRGESQAALAQSYTSAN